MIYSLAQIGLRVNLHPLLGLAMFQSEGQMFMQNIWSSSQNSVTNLVGSSGTITEASYSILSVILLMGVYEAFAKGGAMRDLVILGAEVAACGLLIANWSTFFTDITTNGSFALANSISTNDFYSSLQTTITNMQTFKWSSLSLTDLGQDAIEAIDLLAIGIAMIVYEVAYYVMIFAFTAWGLILMAIGPLLVACLPSSMVSSFGSQYLKGLAQWLSWPVLYAIMGVLVAGLQSNTTWVTNATITTNTNDLTLTGVTITYSLVVLMIPLLANHIINGNFGGAVAQMVQTLSPSGSSKPKKKDDKKDDDKKDGGGGSGGGSGGSGGGSGGSGGGGGGGNITAPAPSPAADSGGSVPSVSAPGASPAAGGAGGAEAVAAGATEAAATAAVVAV